MKRAIFQLFKKNDNNFLKIFLLGLGLAMGMVLISKVYFELSYENFTPHAERVYRIGEKIISQVEDSEKTYLQTPGAIAPGMKEYSPAVETATRYTWFAGKVVVTDEQENYHSVKNVIMADSCLFDIFSRKIYAGDPKEALGVKNNIMISRTFADKLSSSKNYSELIGKTIKSDRFTFIIGGVYEDFPYNSELNDINIILSLSSIGQFMGDGRKNWIGNDRYLSFVRLYPNTDLKDVDQHINKMCQENLPLEDLKKAGMELTFTLTPLQNVHRNAGTVQRMCKLLTIIAFVLILASILNYVLITISAMVRKAKTIAVLKCYGATKKNIYGRFLSDALVHLIVSLLLTAILIVGGKGVIQDLTGTPISALFQGYCFAVLFGVCLLVLFVGGLIPGYIYSNIPVASAFRRYKESSRKWKYILLFVQFGTSMLFITLLAVVMMQYQMMISADTGYSYNNLVYIDTFRIPENKKENIREELERLPFIQRVTRCWELPFNRPAGNNVYLPNDEREYFNIADMYYVAEGYFSIMEIPIIAGRNFDEENPGAREIMVSRKFADKLSNLAGWNDGALGKDVMITEHSQQQNDVYTICGIYEDYLIGTIDNNDVRPSVQFFSRTGWNNWALGMKYILAKLDDITPDKLAQIDKIVQNTAPDQQLATVAYSMEMEWRYAENRRFRDSVMIAGIIILIITIIGLIGYSQDEINRRRSEVAIRKINGATLYELLIMFCITTLKLAVPAVIIGGIVAYYISIEWLQEFSRRIDLSWWIFTGSGLLTTLLVVIVTISTIYKTANANPVNNLKSE